MERPVCVVKIQQADRDKVVEIESGLLHRFRPFSRIHPLYVARPAKVPEPSTRRAEIVKIRAQADERLAVHVDRIRHLIRLRCQREGISTRDTIHDHDYFLTGRGELSPNMPLALSPNIWFQHGSGWVKNIIQKEIGKETWTQHLGLGNKIRVGLPAAVLAANSSSPVPHHLLSDRSGFKLPNNYELFLNIQIPLANTLPSACGLVCSVAVKKGDTLVHHSSCKIGGLLSIKDGEGIDQLVGLTSGHALLDMYLTTDTEDTDTSSLGPRPGRSPHSRLLNWVRDGKGSVKQHRAATSASAEVSSLGPPKHQLKDSTKDLRWKPVKGIYAINWLGGGFESVAEFQFPFATRKPDRLCPDADFALLQLPEELINVFSTRSSEIQHVTGFRGEEEMTNDRVQVILGTGDIVEGTVLWGGQNLYLRGTRFPARKIQLEEPLSIGVSGTWVVQDGLLCGMIALIYEDEPFAYMIAADKFVSDIKKTLGPNIEVSLPPVEGHSLELGKIRPSPALVPFRATRQETHTSSLRSKLESDAVSEDHQPFADTAGQLQKEVVYNTTDRAFIPRDALDRIIQYDKVCEELGKVFSKAEEIDMLSEYICKTSRTLFAALLLVGEAEVIRDCFFENIHDSDLPLKLVEDSRYSWLFERNSVNKPDQITTQPVKLFRDSTTVSVKYFLDRQLSLLAPCFTIGTNGQPLFTKLSPAVILPFIEEISRISTEFYSVTKVRIHPAHHNFRLSGSGYVAIKRFKVQSDAIRRAKELQEYRRLYKEPRLCSPLAAFEHYGCFNVLMPWADGGSLRDLWKRRPKAPPATRTILQWFLRECLGLAQGLSAIHSPWGDMEPSLRVLKQDDGPGSFFARIQSRNVFQPERKFSELQEIAESLAMSPPVGSHGDIKPENILCFFESGNDTPHLSDYGVLKLSDFGMTTFRSLSWDSLTSQSVSWNSETTSLDHTPTYRAPEIPGVSGTGSTQLSDMWSFGCVLLEFASWLLLGLAGVESFTKDRISVETSRGGSFFAQATHKDQCEVTPEVRAWISRLHQVCRQWKAHGRLVSEFLTYVEERLLVVDAEKRDKAAAMVNFFTHLSSRLDGPRTPTPVHLDTAATSARFTLTARSRRRALKGKSVGQSREEMLSSLRLLSAGELDEEEANVLRRLKVIYEVQRENQAMTVKKDAKNLGSRPSLVKRFRVGKARLQRA